ncbi:helix-turn-helix transcriptional regulator [Lysinibacillus sp. CD3-6]|uniref:helix-turn-helix domain-containing protein n=1 Tax=Lysinibacillus sp. CD3-6 TaxID=2892541 RepID=UPI001568853E|nr:helix-turn-helix transcriptional regulator [Lysinibacillus sp. CD3-6]UED79618.1 helix-turn-helix transcriptional regulator [Lysinibacillus sp. CD3-6]
MTKQDFGSYLREKRKTNNLSIVNLSKLSGVSNPYISQLENNKFKPSFEIIKKLTQALNLNFNEAAWIADLYTDEEYRQLKREDDFISSLSLEEERRYNEDQILAAEDNFKINRFKMTKYVDLEDFLNNDSRSFFIKGHRLTNEKIKALIDLFDGLENNYPSDEEIELEFNNLRKQNKELQRKAEEIGGFVLNTDSLIFDLD